MILKFQKHLKDNFHYYLLFMLLQFFVFLYYWHTWGSFSNFVESIDHDSKFMLDFTNHYYPMSRALLYDTTTDVVYLYPAFFAIMLFPLSMGNIETAQAIWLLVEFVSLIILYMASIRWIAKLRPREAVIFSLAWTTSFPLLHNLKWGQVSLLLTACITFALLLHFWQKNVLSGILLAFATAIKIYPGLFLIYLLIKRDRLAIISFTVAFIIFYMLVPTMVMGGADWFEFEKNVQIFLNSVDWTEDINSQYIVHVGLRWFESLFHRTTNSSTVIQILTLIGYAIALSCFAIVWLLRKENNIAGLTLSMVAIFASLPFLIKTSWPHYFIYLPLCQIAMYHYFSSYHPTRNIRSNLFTIFPMISMAMASIFVFNLFPNWQSYNSHGVLFGANFILLIALYIAAYFQIIDQSPKTDEAQSRF